MPIEIKELVIRTVVGRDDARESSGDDGRAASGRAAARAGGNTSTEEIVQECVRQVLQVLKKDRER